MAVLQVEVVIRPIEVRRHHGNVVGAILQVIALTHLQAGNLRDGILLIGVLQRRGQQAILLHRLRRILGIDARRAQEEQLLHSVGISLRNHVALDLHIHHDEVRPV